MRLPACLVGATLAACNGGYVYLDGSRWSEADALFHQDPSFLGAEGGATIDLGDGRTLWLFGDTFVATSPALTRRESVIVHNSVAVMTGTDPLAATMEHAWARGATPGPYFADATGYLRPTGGVRAPGGALVVFLAELRAGPGPSVTSLGARAVRVADPSGPASAWTLEPIALAPPAFAGEPPVITCAAIDGDHVVALAVDGGRDGRFVRWRLAAAAAGDLSAPEWWNGSRWLAEAEVTAPPPTAFSNVALDCTLQHDAPTREWVYFYTGAGGTVDYHDAPNLTGEYGGARQAYVPPAIERSDTIIFGATAHDVGDLAAGVRSATYIDRTAAFADLLDPAREPTLFWPHFVRLVYSEAVE